MSNESEHFGPAAPASAGAAFAGSEQPFDAGEDDFANIGYEAADPSLQSPVWHETMLGRPNKRDWR